MHYVYILKSRLDGTYYVGETRDVELRVQRHNDGWSCSTKGKRPWTLMRVEEYSTRTDAIKREREIKGWKSRQKIELLLLSK